jgi:hypothetical protein
VSEPRTRPPAPTFRELAVLGLASPLAAALMSVPLIFLLIPTPGRDQSIVAVVLALFGLLAAEVFLGPAVAGWLAVRKEQGRGGPGSRRTFLEGSLAGLAWVIVSGLAVRAMGLLG